MRLPLAIHSYAMIYEWQHMFSVKTQLVNFLEI
jgi:hypothetical protein